MFEEAINLIKKQEETYSVQLKNINEMHWTRTTDKLKKNIQREISLRKFILKILYKYRNLK